MALNQDFERSPFGFIRTKVILIPAGILAGEGRFRLAENAAQSCLLQASRDPSDLKGYYVKPEPNSNNQYQLSNLVNFMFTDAMNGCQFIVYGPDRHHVTVEHNNFFNNPGQYQQREQQVRQQNHPYFFILRPHQDYNPLQGVCIIGTYDKTNGWRFFIRQRVDQNEGPLMGPV